MPRVDPDKAVGALVGLAAAGDPQIALGLASSLIEAGGYDPGSRRGGLSVPADATPIGIAFAGHEEALRDATIADAALSDFDPLEGLRVNAAVFDWRMEGREGVGAYELAVRDEQEAA